MVIGGTRMSTNFATNIYKWLINNQSLILPGHCVLCGRTCNPPRDLCSDCENALPWLSRPCPRCARELSGAGDNRHGCADCRKNPPLFTYCVAPLQYREPVDRLVSGFKYHNQLVNGKVLAALLGQALRRFYAGRPLPGLILPVPLHYRRLCERGYNQALELARWISRELRLPVDFSACIRRHSTPPQQGLTADQRKRNLQEAFHLAKPEKIARFRSIALVDDVVTTMATTQAITRLLLSHGVGEVHVWAPCRTLKE